MTQRGMLSREAGQIYGEAGVLHSGTPAFLLRQIEPYSAPGLPADACNGDDVAASYPRIRCHSAVTASATAPITAAPGHRLPLGSAALVSPSGAGVAVGWLG
jgi:hypothetical protein